MEPLQAASLGAGKVSLRQQWVAVSRTTWAELELAHELWAPIKWRPLALVRPTCLSAHELWSLGRLCTMRFGCTTKVLAKSLLKYYRISKCCDEVSLRLGSKRQSLGPPRLNMDADNPRWMVLVPHVCWC